MMPSQATNDAADLRARFVALTIEITRLQNEGDPKNLMNALLDELDAIAPKIEQAERIEAHERPRRQTRDALSTRNASTGGGTSYGVFTDSNAFFTAVADASIRNFTDPRLLRNAIGDVQQEGVGADGGFLLPVDKRSLQVLLAPPEGQSVCGRTDVLLTASNSVSLPIDDDPVWSSTMGSADVAEGGTLTETKQGSFKALTLSLVKKGILVRVTGEMLEDGTNIGPYVLNKTAQKLGWALDKACFAAFMASGAKIALAKTVGAAAGSAPDLANVQTMWTSMITQHRDNAIWIANPKLETKMQTYSVAGANSGIFPVYIPAGGISQAPFPTLYGRPIIYSELSPAVGAEGDLMLVAPTQFFCVMKNAGPRTDVSIHSEFVKDVVAYRSYVRVVCASKFSAPITRGDGTTAGNVITVAVR